MKKSLMASGRFKEFGLDLFFNNTSLAGLFVVGLLSSLFMIILLDIVISFVFIIAGFSTGLNNVIVFINKFLIHPIKEYKQFSDIIFIPFKLLNSLLFVDLFLSVVFLVSVFLEKRMYYNPSYKKKKLAKHLHVFVFFIFIFVLLFCLGFIFQNKIITEFADFKVDFFMSLIVTAGFSLLLTSLFSMLWLGSLYNGFIIYHRFFIFGKNKITKRHIYNSYINKEE